MFHLDKLVFKWILAKCAELGGVFTLGPEAGAFIYFLIIAYGFIISTSKKKGVVKK